MRRINKQITILSEAEQSAFYDLPEYDLEQRLLYFNLTDQELEIALARSTLSAQIYCILQIGYFKAVKTFFRLDWKDVDIQDLNFIVQQYFQNQKYDLQVVSKREYYTQCNQIMLLFGYKPWSKDYETQVFEYANKVIYRDINPQFIAIDVLNYLQAQKIVRPGYTTLQTIFIQYMTCAKRLKLNKVIFILYVIVGLDTSRYLIIL